MVEIPQPPTDEEDEVEQSRMTLGEHLQELRVRLIRATIALVVFFGLAWNFRYPIDDFVQRPYREAAARLNAELVTMAEEAIARDECSWTRSCPVSSNGKKTSAVLFISNERFGS